MSVLQQSAYGSKTIGGDFIGQFSGFRNRISDQLFWEGACLVSLIDRYVYESIADYTGDAFAVADSSLTAATIVYLRYWQQHMDFLSMITRQNLKSLMVDRTHICFRDHFDNLLDHLSTPDFRADDSTIWLYAAFCFTFLMQWYEQGCRIPVEEMAKNICVC